MTCIILNGYDNDLWPQAGVVSKQVFHNLEFWATFVFSCVEVIALVYSPKPLGAIYRNTLLLKLIISVNIVVSFLTSMLVTLNLEEFETISHEMEYANELTMALFDLIILVSLLRARGAVSRSKQADSYSSIAVVLGSIVIAIVQLGVYNGMGVDDDGERRGEQAAHYCEFAFEILSAAVTFWFCMDNKLMCDNLSMTIMLADASVVTIEVHTREAEDAHPLMRQTLQNCTVQPIMALPAAPSHSGGEQGIGQQAPYAIELRN